MIRKLLAVLALLATSSDALAGSKNLVTSEKPQLPFYSFAIQSRQYKHAGAITESLHEQILGSVWRCDIAYSGLGVISRCTAPSTVGILEIITRVSCVSSDADAQTVRLSTLDDGAYAVVYIACRRDNPDDGF